MVNIAIRIDIGKNVANIEKAVSEAKTRIR